MKRVKRTSRVASIIFTMWEILINVSFPHAVEDKEGQVRLLKILKYNLECPPNTMSNKSPLLE